MQGRSQTYQNEGEARGGGVQGADQDSKWGLSTDPCTCTKCHFMGGGEGDRGPLWLCPWQNVTCNQSTFHP